MSLRSRPLLSFPLAAPPPPPPPPPTGFGEVIPTNLVTLVLSDVLLLSALLFHSEKLMLLSSFVLLTLGGERAQLEGAVKYVWVVDEDTMTVSRREVTIADGIGEYAIVTDGLSAGETIITAGAAFIAEGMQVRPWTE